MLESVRRLYDILDRKERNEAFVLLVSMLISGVVGVTGVASILPFLDTLANPEAIQTTPYLKWAYDAFGFESDYSFTLFLGGAVFVVVVAGIALQALTQYFTVRYTFLRGYSWSARLMEAYFSRPYFWFLNRHSADLGKAILSEVEQVIHYSLLPFLQLLSGGVQTLLIVGLLLVVDPEVAILAAVILGSTYGLIYWRLKQYLERIGEKRIEANQRRYQVSQEAFGGIKEVKAAGLESGYLHSFRKAALGFAKFKTHHGIISILPGFAIQGIAFGGIIIILMYLMVTRSGNLLEVVPLMGMFAFAGIKLLPILSIVYQSLTKLKYGKPALELLHKDMFEVIEDSDGAIAPRVQTDNLPVHSEQSPTRFSDRLELSKVGYTYPKSQTPALSGIDLTIRANTTVGFAGSTGAGKTTIVDVILGLLPPQEGALIVDGNPISRDNVVSWQRTLGYVPQHIFLADDTITANIAFGIRTDQVDHAAVERAARIADLHDFVSGELEHGYQTMVGERGVRLSGGQRQRIGIARALYNDPDVLIMDEATSALDNLTERAVMSAIQTLSSEKTIIMIAHRLSTVKNCDTIFLLEHGKLIAQGTYEDLLKNSASFKKMAEANE